MAWSWSHSNEAYRDANENLQDCDMIFLAEALTEWLLWASNGFLDDMKLKIEAALLTNPYSDRECLAERVWQFASSWEFGRTCDNGGFNAWVCPHGCHTVPFDREEEG